MSKAELRQRFRRSREHLPAEIVVAWSSAIAARLTTLRQWHESSVIHVYVGTLPGEVRTDQVIDCALQERKRVICPVVRPHGQLEHRELADRTDLVDSAFGLREPYIDVARPADPSEAELIVVPGVVFSENGSRVGMGGGYYDRFLSQQAGLRVGLAFELQVVDTLPTDPNDQPLDMLITELQAIQCRSRR